MSSDPSRRINDHNIGYKKTTKPYKPFSLILFEEYPTKYFKPGVRFAYLKPLAVANGNSSFFPIFRLKSTEHDQKMPR